MTVSGWVVVIPVKPLARAKSRLAGQLGALRASLAYAFAADTVEACLAATSVIRTVILTEDPEIRALAARSGAEVCDESTLALGLGPSAGSANGRLNVLLRRFARRFAPRSPLVVVPADLPCLRPADLDAALRRADAFPSACLADRHVVGTTLLTAHAGEDLHPAYGPYSVARHVARGARLLRSEGLERAQADVDTIADLRYAARLGVGRHTRMWGVRSGAALEALAHVG
ncbi:MAG: 2-phospho-L-lactate guanylyltransferase [Acidothermus sp.]|nr:2-phospho-L-lactate guanylyltransferase [Acidothermus sp.]